MHSLNTTPLDYHICTKHTHLLNHITLTVQMQRSDGPRNPPIMEAISKDSHPPVSPQTTLEPPMLTSTKGKRERKTSIQRSDSFFDNRPMILRMDTLQKQTPTQEEMFEAISFDSEKEDRLKDLTGILKDMDEIERKSFQQEEPKDATSFDRKLRNYGSEEEIVSPRILGHSEPPSSHPSSKHHLGILPQQQDQDVSFSQNISAIRGTSFPLYKQRKQVSRQRLMGLYESVSQLRTRFERVKVEFREKLTSYQSSTIATLRVISAHTDDHTKQIQLNYQRLLKEQEMKNHELRIEKQTAQHELHRVNSQLLSTEERCSRITEDLNTAYTNRGSDRRRQGELQRQVKTLQERNSQLQIHKAELERMIEEQSRLFEGLKEEPSLNRQTSSKEGVQRMDFGCMTIKISSPKEYKPDHDKTQIVGSAASIDYNVLQKAQAESQQLIQELKLKNKRLQKQLGELELDNTSAMSKIKHLKDALVQKELELSRQEDELLTSQTKVRELRNRNEETGGRQRNWAMQMRAQRERSDQEIVKVQKQNQDLKRQQQKIRNLLKDSQEQLSQCQQYISRLNAQIEQLRREKDHMSHTLNSLEHQSNFKLHDYDTYLTQIEQMMNEVSNKNRHKEREIEERQSQVRTRSHELDRKMMEVMNREQQVEAMQSDYEHKIMILQKRQQGMKAEYHMAINAQNATRDRWYQRYFQVVSPSKSPSRINERDMRPSKVRPSEINKKINSPRRQFLGNNNNDRETYSRDNSWRGRNQLAKHRSQGNILSPRQMRAASPRRNRDPTADPFALNNRITRLRQVLTRQLCDVSGNGGKYTSY